MQSYFPCCLITERKTEFQARKKVIFYFLKITSSILKQAILLLNVAMLVLFVAKKIKISENIT